MSVTKIGTRLFIFFIIFPRIRIVINAIHYVRTIKIRTETDPFISFAYILRICAYAVVRSSKSSFGIEFDETKLMPSCLSIGIANE